MRNAIVMLMSLALAAPAWAAAAESPEDLLKQAQQLETQGKAAQAVEAYQNFLKTYPDHSQTIDVHYRLGNGLNDLGLIDEAIPHLETVARSPDKRYRHRLDACYLLGKLYATLRNYEGAAAVFEQMLGEGAGLYEDEVLSLCGGYYAVLKKYDEAAAKFNLLKRRENAKFAEQGAYKLAVLWLRAEKLDLAVEAVQDLAVRFPQNKEARGLMVEIADLFRKQGKLDQAIAVCEQLRSRYPGTPEANGIGYVLGLCWRDRKQFDKAVQALDDTARLPANRKTGLAAEALLQAAEICFSDKAEIDKAIARYDEAAKCAREAGGERQAQILEQCYFRLAEHYYSQKNWSVALENYLLLRKLGTKINLLPKILRCQAELQLDSTLAVRGDADVEFIRQKIQENAGTFVAAEAEVFLLDRQLAEALDRKGATAGLPEQYAALLKKYPREVLAQQSLESYIYCQIGMCFAAEDTPAAQRNAMAAFERAVAVDPNTPYKRDALENLARAADAAGDTQKAFQVYERLFEMSAAEAEKKGEAQADAALAQRMAEYLRSMITRAEQKDSVEEALAVAQRVIDKKGVFSEAARHAMFYMGELYYLKKDFATAAKTYRQFLKAYGPPQDAKGEVVNGPWKPSSQSEQTEQVYEAAARIAHCWFAQGHTQNMVAAYEWIVRNFTYRNRWMAEARYWLAQELIKGKKGLEAEARRRFAEAIWKTVVHPSLDFEDRDFRKNFHFWTADPTMQKYVKAAILKAGQAFSEVGDHDLAAGVFRQYLELYPERLEHRRGGSDQPDPLRSIARYALGREYVALANVTRLVESYRPYLDGLRDDKFRGSALMLLGYHAAAGGATEAAVEAYATLLDEYGENESDSQGRLIPVPTRDRVRKSKYNWDGIRLEPPPGLNLGEVRYSLGYLYWKKEEWANGVRILAPFAEDPRLLSNPARAKALYMAAQSYYRLYDYPNGLALVKKILRDHPRFEAIEEVYVAAARGCIETRQWSEVEPLVQRFVRDQPRSPHRPHMDLYAAVAMLGLGKTDEGLARLKSIAESETYEDVKADACYHLGLHWLNQKPPDYRTAAGHLDKSVAMYPREASCLAAAKCYVELKDWPKARDLLERTLRAFPGGNPQVLDEARRQLSEVQKQMVKQG